MLDDANDMIAGRVALNRTDAADRQVSQQAAHHDLVASTSTETGGALVRGEMETQYGTVVGRLLSGEYEQPEHVQRSLEALSAVGMPE